MGQEEASSPRDPKSTRSSSGQGGGRVGGEGGVARDKWVASKGI